MEEKATVPILLRVAPAERAAIEQNSDIIGRLAKVSAIEFVDAMPEGTGVRSAPGFDVAVVYERTIDVAVECERLKKELARFEKEISNADRQLSNEGFLAKAPANVVEGLRRRAAELSVLIPKTRAALDSLNCDNAVTKEGQWIGRAGGLRPPWNKPWWKTGPPTTSPPP